MKELYCKLMHLLLIIFLCLVSTKVFDLRICDILLLTFLIICVSVSLSVNNATAIIFASNGYESYYAIDSMVVLVCNGFTVTIIVHPQTVDFCLSQLRVSVSVTRFHRYWKVFL